MLINFLDAPSSVLSVGNNQAKKSNRGSSSNQISLNYKNQFLNLTSFSVMSLSDPTPNIMENHESHQLTPRGNLQMEVALFHPLLVYKKKFFQTVGFIEYLPETKNMMPILTEISVSTANGSTKGNLTQQTVQSRKGYLTVPRPILKSTSKAYKNSIH